MGDRFFRLCDRRYLAWLVCKVDQTVAALRELGGDGFRGMGEGPARQYAVRLATAHAECLKGPEPALLTNPADRAP